MLGDYVNLRQSGLWDEYYSDEKKNTPYIKI